MTLRVATLLILALGLAACDALKDLVGPGHPARLEAVSAETVTGVAGTPLAEPLSVRVVDGSGEGVGGVSVEWIIGVGSPNPTVLVRKSGDKGLTTLELTLRQAVGTQTVAARVAGLTPVTFNVQVVAGPPAAATISAGNNQTGAVGDPLPLELAVRVVDQFGNPTPGVQVAWAVTAGGGSLGASTSATAADGVARIRWTLGSAPGAHAARATPPGLAALTFAATATTGAPASLAKVSGDNQTGTVGGTLAQDLVVRVADRFGNPVSGRAVTWAVATGGGSVSSTATTTSAQGEARVRWTVGTGVSTQSVTASATGLTSQTFTATAQAGAAAKLVKVGGGGLSGAVGTALADSVTVRVTDAFDNPLQGVSVTWQVTGGGGLVNPAVSATTAAGLARTAWSLGTLAGTHTVVASVAGLTPVSIGATAVPGAPFAINKLAGDGQSAPVATALPDSVGVTVTDRFGNFIPGATVTWTVLSGGGSASPATAPTNGSGAARTRWTLGTLVGNQSLAAGAPGLAPISFIANGISDGTAIANGAPVTGLSGAAGSAAMYKINLPAGVAQLQVTLSGGSGNADLYVRFGQTPTTAVYDCRSINADNAETCTLANPGGADWLVLVSGTTAFSGVTLLAQHGAPEVLVTVSPASVTLVPAQTQQLSATVQNATNPGVTWSTTDASIATVNGSGLVTAVATGTATITATSQQDTRKAASATISVQSPGSLTVTVTGLPAGAGGAITVTGPNSYSQAVTATQTLTNLVPGTYTVAATNVTASGTTYSPSPGSQVVTVAAGGAASANVAYAVAPTLNLTIDGMYLTQSAQSYTRGVPLVKDRAAYLRVFAKANQSNTVTPSVRARFYSSGTLVSTQTLSAPSASVPTSITEDPLSTSWNYAVPASLIQSGLSVLVDVDPDNAIPESSESDNSFPTSGTALALDVRTTNPLSVRLVPVLQSVNGLQGDATTSNKDSFLSTTSKIFPLASYDADVRSVYTTSAGALNATDTNSAWVTIITEVEALRAAEGTSRYYLGVVKASYTSGIAGLGYTPGRTALTWDYQPSGDGIAAHEIGHNWGRDHAPCGNPGSVDASYPYSAGSIGIYGLDVSAVSLKSPSTYTDIMGYCSQQWVSDYTYNAVLSYRASNPEPPLEEARPSLLVWGRADDGELVLEPAFEVDARPLLPRAGGPYAVEGLDADGERLFSLSFAGQEIAEAPRSARAFAFVVPVEQARPERLAALRLSGPAGAAVRRRIVPAAAPGAEPTSPSAARVAPGRVRVTWDAAARPMVMVRDPGTGEILSFARGGEVTLATEAAELEVVGSDGVSSRLGRVVVRR